MQITERYTLFTQTGMIHIALTKRGHLLALTPSKIVCISSPILKSSRIQNPERLYYSASCESERVAVIKKGEESHLIFAIPSEKLDAALVVKGQPFSRDITGVVRIDKHHENPFLLALHTRDEYYTPTLIAGNSSCALSFSKYGSFIQVDKKCETGEAASFTKEAKAWKIRTGNADLKFIETSKKGVRRGNRTVFGILTGSLHGRKIAELTAILTY